MTVTAPQRRPPLDLDLPRFDDGFRDRLEELFRWRRDVRQFRRDPIDPSLLEHLLGLVRFAPSVGLSQPWRFVVVEDPARRQEIQENFKHCNREALADYAGERAKLYAKLKLAGLAEAPVHLAVFCDQATNVGHGLGRKTMPETLRDSTVTAIYTLWLAARAYDVGVGWVSILEPEEVRDCLDVPKSWALVAYLCLGYPEAEDQRPELEREGWEQRQSANETVFRR